MLVLGCRIDESTGRVANASGLSFAPNAIEIKNSFPGTHTFVAELKNNAVKDVDVILAGTCSCVSIIEPKTRVKIRSGAKQMVRFTLTKNDSSPIDQAIIVTDLKSDSVLTTLPVEGRHIPAIVSTANPIRLHRPVSTSRVSFPPIILQLAKDIVIRECYSNTGDFSLAWQQDADTLHVTPTHSGTQKDGEGSLAIVISYQDNGRTTAVFPFSITSKLVVEPSQIWAGKLGAGDIANSVVTISSAHDLTDLGIEPSQPNISVKTERISANRILAHCTIRTPNAGTSQMGNVVITSKGAKLASIPVKALLK